MRRGSIRRRLRLWEGRSTARGQRLRGEPTASCARVKTRRAVDQHARPFRHYARRGGFNGRTTTSRAARWYFGGSRSGFYPNANAEYGQQQSSNQASQRETALPTHLQLSVLNICGAWITSAAFKAHQERGKRKKKHGEKRCRAYFQ